MSNTMYSRMSRFHRRFAWQAMLGLLLVAGLVIHVHAETRVLEPQGEYASIDTRLANQTIHMLMEGTDSERVATVREVISAPQNYAPPVFYVLSAILFKSDLKDDAAFWFYAGQLRARFDANRCNDASARSAVTVLNKRYGAAINQYMFQDPSKLLALVEKVVEWDRKTPIRYDHRWINLSGMDATTSALGNASNQAPLSLPEDQWSAIAEKTRTDYLAGLRAALGKAQ